MAVSNPLRYRIALVESTPMTRAFKYIVPAVLCSFALNIPKFLEVEVNEGARTQRGPSTLEVETKFDQLGCLNVAPANASPATDFAQSCSASDYGFQKVVDSA